MNDMKNSKLQEILDAKETRAAKQLELIKKYHAPLVSFTLNIPGPDKNLNTLIQVHNTGMKALEEQLKKGCFLVNDKIYKDTAGGLESLYSINADALSLKKITIDIEQTHPLGRIFDFDVFDEEGKLIGRKDLNLEERSCMICDEKAVICRRNQSHTLKELLIYINGMINNYYSH